MPPEGLSLRNLTRIDFGRAVIGNRMRIDRLSALGDTLQNGVQKVPPEGLPLWNLARKGLLLWSLTRIGKASA